MYTPRPSLQVRRTIPRCEVQSDRCHSSCVNVGLSQSAEHCLVMPCSFTVQTTGRQRLSSVILGLHGATDTALSFNAVQLNKLSWGLNMLPPPVYTVNARPGAGISMTPSYRFWCLLSSCTDTSTTDLRSPEITLTLPNTAVLPYSESFRYNSSFCKTHCISYSIQRTCHPCK